MRTSTIRTITLLLLITSFCSAISQNYRVLQPERTTLYQSENEIILGMRVDSVRVEGSDTIYYLLKNLQQVDFSCFHIEGPSWMGDRITIRSDGETVFYNVADQPVMIKTKAVLNEDWVCYSTPELSFRASISSLDIADILGIPDSVKTVSFQAMDIDGQNTDHEVNDMHLILSENHGLIQTLNFFDFPDFGFGITLPWITELTLSGFNNPEAGIQNLTWKEIHDHNPGDELHTVEIYSDITYSFRKETLSILLEKSIDGDTIYYNWENRTKVMINNSGNGTFSANIDTLLQKIYSNPGFDQLPGMAFGVDNSELFSTTFMKEDFYGITKARMGGYGTVEPYYFDSCYHHPIFDNCFPNQEYYKGLGGPYYAEQFGFDTCIRYLAYYKKDGVEWGFPLDFTVNTTLQPIEAKLEIVEVFPNPATDLVNIKLSILNRSVNMTVIDSQGLERGNYLLNGKESQINIQHLKPGIYLFRFTTGNQSVIRRVVKQ